VFRRRRSSDLPVVHLGTIASGDSLVINAAIRDRLSGEYGGSILCFECGSAGAMLQAAAIARGLHASYLCESA
jgi:hypothetical protein